MTPMSLYFDSGSIANSTAYVKTLLELGNGARQLEGDILEVSMDPIYRKAQPSDLQQPRVYETREVKKSCLCLLTPCDSSRCPEQQGNKDKKYCI
jgi:hypothetical protein